MADTTFNPEIIIDRWSNEYKELYQELLMADPLVRWVSGEFPDGAKLTIPTFSEMNVRSYTEGDEVVLDDANTGKFELTIDKYYTSGFKVTDALKQDAFYTSQFVAHYTKMLFRALMEKKELEIYELQSQQTAGNANTVDGAAHRLGATGTDGVVTLADIAKAKYAMSKSNVPRSSWMAVVDPSVTYQLVQIDNVIRQDVYGANKHIVEGISMSEYLGSYMGFKFYESNMLDSSTSSSVDIDGTTSVDTPVYNMFCGAGETFIGAMRQEIKLESWRINERFSDAYATSIRYGLDLFRPESLFVLGSNGTV